MVQAAGADGYRDPRRSAVVLLLLCLATESLGEGCKQNATCEPLTHSSCLGATLPYARTALIFADGAASQLEAQAKLSKWSGLQAAPKCWEVVQPLLCSTLMPRCNDSLVDAPPKELCQKIREPCDFVRIANGGKWPEFLDCDRPQFSSDPECKSETYTRLRFPYNGSCLLPLVNVGDSKENSFEGMPGCGVQCSNPAYTDQEHDDLHAFIAVLAVTCFVCTLSASLTFVVDWKNASRYPGLMLLYIDICFAIGCLAWLAQFFGSTSRSDIVCQHDGTVRLGEPRIGSGEPVACIITFVIIYYSVTAAAAWFVALTYGWHVTFHALRIGASPGKLESRMSYVHISAWCCPLILTIVCLATQQVDGDSMAGICFVGYGRPVSRALLLLVPVAAAVFVGVVFIFMGLKTLLKIRKDSPPEIYEKITVKINSTIIRLGVFAAMMCLFAVVAIATQAHLLANKGLWDSSMRDYIMCTAGTWYNATLTPAGGGCSPASRPNLFVQYAGILCHFGTGILMSSWVWTNASYEIWKRFFRRLLHKPSNKPVKLRRHRVVAQAFQKRTNSVAPRLSLDFHSTHDDPLGMKLDLHSIMSNDVPSTFVQVVPKLLKRRGGMAPSTVGTLRRYSDSDVQSIRSVIESTSKWTADDAHTKGTEGQARAGAARSRRRLHRGRARGAAHPPTFNPADILAMQAALNAQCESSLGGDAASASKAETWRHASDVSMSSRASAQSGSVTLDKHLDGEASDAEDYGDPRGNGAMALEAIVPAAHLHQLALATYALFTASQLLPPGGHAGASMYHQAAAAGRQPRGGARAASTSTRSSRMKAPGGMAHVNYAAESDITDVSSMDY